MEAKASDRCRQHYDKECEAGVNKQINMEFHAMYTYLSLVRNNTKAFCV